MNQGHLTVASGAQRAYPVYQIRITGPGCWIAVRGPVHLAAGGKGGHLQDSSSAAVLRRVATSGGTSATTCYAEDTRWLVRPVAGCAYCLSALRVVACAGGAAAWLAVPRFRGETLYALGM